VISNVTVRTLIAVYHTSELKILHEIRFFLHNIRVNIDYEQRWLDLSN